MDEPTALVWAQDQARLATQAELSKTARALINSAHLNGWKSTATRAQGYGEIVVMVEDVGGDLTPTGRTPRKKITQTQLVSSVVVRLRSPEGARAVVVFEAGKPAGAWVWVDDLDGASPSNVTTIAGLVAGTWPTPKRDAELPLALLELNGEAA